MSPLKLKALCAIAVCVALTGGGFGLYAISSGADDQKPTQPGTPPAAKPDGEKKPGSNPNDQKDKKLRGKSEKGKNEKNEKDEKEDEHPGSKKRKPEDDRKPEKPQKPGGDKPKTEKPLNKFGGKVASVDAPANTISLVAKGDDGLTEKTFPLAAGARVFIDGQEAKLADTPRGSIASFMTPMTNPGKPAPITELRITGPTLTGLIKEVDAVGITLDGAQKPHSIKLATNGKATINGKDVVLTDLKIGDKVAVTLTVDESAALLISSARSEGEKGEKGEKPEKPGTRRGVLSGRVTVVDATARMISVSGKGDLEWVARLTADAKVIVDGKEAKFADIPKGALATLTVAAREDQPYEASAVTVTGPALGGTIKQAGAAEITLGNEKLGARTLKVLPVTKVTISGKDAKAADLKVGDKVTVTLTTDESGALAITVAGEKVKPGGDKPKREKEDD
jgi:hypothetical protein